MICEKCKEEVPDQKLLKHLRESHLGETDLNVHCPVCNLLLNTVPKFQKHWYATHHVSKKKATTASLCEAQPQVHDTSEVDSEKSQLSDELVPSQNLPESSNESVVVEDRLAKRPRLECSIEDDTASVSVIPSLSGNEDTVVVDNSVLKNPPSSSDTNVMDTLRELHLHSASSASHVPDNDVQSESSDSNESEESEGEVLEEAVTQSVAKCESVVQSSHVNENAAEFLLHLKEKCNVPAKSTREVLHHTEKLVKGALQDFVGKVDEKLKCHNTKLDNLLNVKDAIEATTKSLFNKLQTDHQQNKYFQNNLCVTEPVRYSLGREFRRVRRKRKSSMETIIVQEEFIYVPVDKIVEKLVNHPDYKRFVEEGAMSGNSDVLDSYMKGEKWKKNSVLKEHPDALRFVLYYDDLEVCSPLKSKAGKHKLGGFYMYLDNIPLKYRSNLNLIFIVGLVNANLVKGTKYGMDAALEHIVGVLQKFEDGVILQNGQKVYGTLIATIGDNLGAHAIGGFKEGFTAHRLCRFCNATYEETKKMTTENVNLLRDEASHRTQCEKVQTSKGKNDKLSTEFGVNRNSLLNNLKSYHVIQGLPPDILHDFLEGSLPLTVKRFLNYHLYEKTIKDRKFTLDWLNAAIRDFDYGYCEVADKPSELKKDYIQDTESASLHQSGCQMWMLATIIPVILGPYINVDDQRFQNLLDLLEITRIVFSSEISKWMVITLKDLIETYLTDFISLYGSLIPKQHFMIHYPTLILLLGPLINFMCMRCEAKHKYFKKIVNVLGNYKHVPWTLSKRHQLSQGVAWRKTLLKAPKVGPFLWKYVKDLSYASLLGSGTSKVIEANWLELNGIKFVSDKCFICVGSSDSIPEFAKVIKVLVYPSCLFVCQSVVTRSKNVHLAAYEIDLLSKICIIHPHQLILPKVFHAHKALERDFIILKQCAKDALF